MPHRLSLPLSRGRGLRAALVLAGMVPLAPSAARADTEAWLWVENRVPLVRTERPEAGRVDLRVFGDFRLNRRSEGLGVVIARMGPLFYVTDWLFVASTGSFVSSRSADGAWLQQARAELEPNLLFRIGDLTFADRNRGEYRFSDGLRDSAYYRNLLRISYAPQGARWIPYVFDEVLFNVTTHEVTENRASVGLGRLVGTSTRVDLGYMFRSRKEASLVHDHVLNLFFFLDVPPPERAAASEAYPPPCEPPSAPTPPTPPPVSAPPATPVPGVPSPAHTEDGG